MNAKFFGGSADGIELDIHEAVWNLRIPVPAEFTLDLPLDPSIPKFDYEDYELQPYLGAGATLLYFAIDREEGKDK